MQLLDSYEATKFQIQKTRFQFLYQLQKANVIDKGNKSLKRFFMLRLG